MQSLMRKSKFGFTLIELIILVGIFVLLLAIVYTAVDPSRRYVDARNTNRLNEVNAVLDAVAKFSVDHNGNLPANLQTASADVNYILGTASVGCDTGCDVATQSSCLDMTADLVTVNHYMFSIPYDPGIKDSKSGTNKSLYYISKKAGGAITVGACNAESVGGATPVIMVSR